MKPQPIVEDELHGLADGRIKAPRRGEVEAWLSSRPQEAEQVQAWRAQNTLLHLAYDRVLEEPLPTRLLDATRRPGRSHFSSQRLAAAVAWLALGGILGFFLRGEFPKLAATPQAMLPYQAALAHAVYSPEVRHPVEVGAEQEAHLVAWLSKRLGATLKTPHLEEAGYALLGGRLLPGEGGSGSGAVAQFMYQDARGARLTLYVRNDAGAANTRETAFRFAREGKIGVFYWLDGRFGYALSAEIEKSELLRIANIVYRQLNP